MFAILGDLLIIIGLIINAIWVHNAAKQIEDHNNKIEKLEKKG